MDPAAITAIAEILFALDAPASILVDAVYRQIPQYQREQVDEILDSLRERHLIGSSFDYKRVLPRADGREASRDGSLLALLFGDNYIFARSREAVVHIVVEDQEGEYGGTGFFCADFEGSIVTADHVVRGRKVVRIEDHRGNSVSNHPLKVILGSDDLDIALIRCACPEGVNPLKIEWRPEMIEAPLDVLVMGYPPIAQHYPALYLARGAVTANPKDYRLRAKLGLSDVTHPGCSGGPVISKRGFVVGIVEQQNELDRVGTTYVFRTATPAYYIRQVIERNEF